jgi:hypothetical protein
MIEPLKLEFKFCYMQVLTTGAEFEDALQGIRKDWGKPATTNGERCGRNVKSDRSSSKSYFTSVII